MNQIVVTKKIETRKLPNRKKRTTIKDLAKEYLDDNESDD